jgi:hypothetical protein
MNKLKEYLSTIVLVIAVAGGVSGSLAYFAKASELEALRSEVVLTQTRLDQKIVGDQLYETQKAIWALEERNVRHTSDCSQWPDARDREQYKKLKAQLEELQKKQDKLIKK